MQPYLYLKEDRFEKIKKSHRNGRKIITSSLLVLGSILILNTILPIVKYEVFTERRFLKASAEDKIISPLILGEETSLPRMEEEIDFTLLSNWFLDKKEFSQSIKAWQPSRIRRYTLSIPSLGIFDADVKIGGNDLDESLLHFGGSSLPGEIGNAVVFGHSVLPQFFNPKNYTTIFSTLPTLKKGDEIFVHYDGVLYKYVVETLETVKPDNLSILEQETDDSFLTLVTCVPPGTYWKRLAVKARLIKI